MICWNCGDPATHPEAGGHPPSCDACLGWREFKNFRGGFNARISKPNTCGYCGKQTAAMGYRDENGKRWPPVCVRYECIEKFGDDIEVELDWRRYRKDLV